MYLSDEQKIETAQRTLKAHQENLQKMATKIELASVEVAAKAGREEATVRDINLWLGKLIDLHNNICTTRNQIDKAQRDIAFYKERVARYSTH